MAYTEAQRQYYRDYYRRRRQSILDHLGGVCVVCGSAEDLHVDHVDPSDKSIVINQRLTLSSLLDELQKCQLLCSLHHREKTAREQMGFTHGTIYAWMQKKCKCVDCTVAKWAWHDARNAQRRKTNRPYTKSR